MLVDTQKFIENLATAGVPNARSEAAKIFDLVRGTEGGEFSFGGRIEVEPAQVEKIGELIEKRAQRIPFARLTEFVRFADVEIEAGEGVYAPTVESENVIDHAAALLEGVPKARILDLGSGSGFLLLALLHAVPGSSGIGIDCSEKAIELGQRNAVRNCLQDRAEFRIGNWAEKIDEKFDLVISNPPRAATGDVPSLMPELREHDPLESLDGGDDGLKFFRQLAVDFRRLALRDGCGVFQAGPMQAKPVQRLFIKCGFKKTRIIANYLNQPAGIVVML
ncbi:MAG: HemK family protein methyltransferase [Alphaproteobacteria bacterium]|nr:HemK family protein methyltransferase [Alphaproteobacteria bacterium]